MLSIIILFQHYINFKHLYDKIWHDKNLSVPKALSMPSCNNSTVKLHKRGSRLRFFKMSAPVVEIEKNFVWILLEIFTEYSSSREVFQKWRWMLFHLKNKRGNLLRSKPTFEYLQLRRRIAEEPLPMFSRHCRPKVDCWRSITNIITKNWNKRNRF